MGAPHPPGFPGSLLEPRPDKPGPQRRDADLPLRRGAPAVEDLVTMAGPFIDRAKLAYGSSLLAERGTLAAVIELLDEGGRGRAIRGP